MPRYREQQLVDIDCRSLFGVVADVEPYPAFLPGWVEVGVVGRKDRAVIVDQTLGVGPIRTAFRSRAEIHPPRGLRVSARDGPFRELQIDWKLEPVEARRCLVMLQVVFSLRPRYWVLNRLFKDVARRLIPIFVDRARVCDVAERGTYVSEQG